MDKKLSVLVMLVVLSGLAADSTRGDLATGLVANWQFEGDFNDSAGTNHGTAVGDAKIVADPNRGQVLELDGTGDYVEVPNSPALNITGNRISMAAWVRFNNVGPVQIIIAKVVNNTTHTSPYFAYGLHMLANGQPRVWISRTGGSSNRAGTANMFKAGIWHHVAGVYNGAQLQLYVDGQLAASSNVTGDLRGYDTVLRLGINGGLTEPMAGRMDDVRIYNRDLSAREVLSLATGISLSKAWDPNPADGAVGVESPLLQWMAGENAVLHDVYLGTSAELGVANLVAPAQATPLYLHAPSLEPGVTYYWRVDEVEADLTTVHTGDVWSFTALDPNLVGWWRFEEGKGTTIVDSSGHGRNGTALGDPNYADGPAGYGQALVFDGKDDVVDLGKPDVVGGGITLAAWVNPNSFAINDARIISKAKEWGANDHWWMLSTVTGAGSYVPRFRLKTDESDTVPTLIGGAAGVLALGEWAHVTATWDGAAMVLYVDGVEVGRMAKGGTAVAVDPTVSAAIGSQPPDAFAPATPSHVVKFFDGLIDEVRIYNRALSELEIHALAGVQ